MAVHIRNLKEIAKLDKDLVLGDPPATLMVKDLTFALFNFGTLPLGILSDSLCILSDTLCILNDTLDILSDTSGILSKTFYILYNNLCDTLFTPNKAV